LTNQNKAVKQYKQLMFSIKVNLFVMIFVEGIKQIREKLQIKQRKISIAFGTIASIVGEKKKVTGGAFQVVSQTVKKTKKTNEP
jgi:DNA-binding transcriptional regulator YiaG